MMLRRSDEKCSLMSTRGSGSLAATILSAGDVRGALVTSKDSLIERRYAYDLRLSQMFARPRVSEHLIGKTMTMVDDIPHGHEPSG